MILQELKVALLKQQNTAPAYQVLEDQVLVVVAEQLLGGGKHFRALLALKHLRRQHRRRRRRRQRRDGRIPSLKPRGNYIHVGPGSSISYIDSILVLFACVCVWWVFECARLFYIGI